MLWSSLKKKKTLSHPLDEIIIAFFPAEIFKLASCMSQNRFYNPVVGLENWRIKWPPGPWWTSQNPQVIWVRPSLCTWSKHGKAVFSSSAPHSGNKLPECIIVYISVHFSNLPQCNFYFLHLICSLLFFHLFIFCSAFKLFIHVHVLCRALRYLTISLENIKTFWIWWQQHMSKSLIRVQEKNAGKIIINKRRNILQQIRWNGNNMTGFNDTFIFYDFSRLRWKMRHCEKNWLLWLKKTKEQNSNNKKKLWS